MSQNHGPADFGFVWAVIQRGGKHQRVARFQCVECDDLLDINTRPGLAAHPTHMAKLAINRGWRADAFRKSKIICSKCAMPARQPQDFPDEKVIQMPPATSIKAVPTPLTTDQRLKIRSLLDANFDDAKGMYLADMSDEKIAVQVNVARVHVEQIREVGYGPIKVDPEIAGLRNEAANINREIVGQQKGLDILKAKAKELEDRVAKLEGKRAA